jgi:O-antigen/teichoic acid export membrane protein
VNLRLSPEPMLNDAREFKYANAVYGVVDYLALPIGMLLAAPFLLKHLGVGQYGVWIMTSAAVSSGGIVSGGFGDAVIKHIGQCRSREDWSGAIHIVRNMILINLALSGVLATVLWCLAPYVTRHVVKTDYELQVVCLQALRIGSVLLVIKSIEGIFINSLRAFETYGPTVRIAVCSRTAILAASVVLTGCGRNIVWIMLATVVLSLAGVLAQALALQRKIGRFLLMPSWHAKTMSDIAAFGVFSWVQAISSVVFSQADRFLVGFVIGAPAVAYYGLCVQAAQPIHGLISSGMHFLFPHFSSRYSVSPVPEIKRKVSIAIKANLIMVGILSLPVMMFGRHILRVWTGGMFDHEPSAVFPIIVCSFALLGTNVTAHYTLLAIGQIKVVTYLNLLAGIAMLLLMAILIPGYGLHGAAVARLIYGPITCLAYFQLYRVLWSPGLSTHVNPSSIYKVVATDTD